MRRDLVIRAMAHDHEAFSDLARLSIEKLYTVARLILRDTHRAEDATQEALVLAWRDLAALRDPDRFEVWMRRLLVNACYKELRKDRDRRRFEVRVDPIEQGLPDASRNVADRDQIERAFRRLEPEQRALIVLHYHLGLSLSDTADAMDLPIGTAKSRLHRATQAMRATLDADERAAFSLGLTA
jgi:RNA polymerase sigma-70 factor (ECF subfamily)